MKASILLIAASAGATLAHAASVVERGDSICPNASYNLPLCCFTTFLGPEELLDCRHRKTTPFHPAGVHGCPGVVNAQSTQSSFLFRGPLLLTYIDSIDGSVKDFSDFKKSCREVGGAAVKCCNIPFAGEPQLCEDPVRI